MGMKFLVAFDNSDGAKKALRFAMNMKGISDEYVICYVSPLVMGAGPNFDAYVPPSLYKKSDETSDVVLSAARELIEKENVNATFLKLDAPGEQIARVMANQAKERGVDMIITGTRRLSGISKMLLGSVSSEVVKLSSIPVLVVPPD